MFIYHTQTEAFNSDNLCFSLLSLSLTRVGGIVLEMPVGVSTVQLRPPPLLSRKKKLCFFFQRFENLLEMLLTTRFYI